MHNRFILTAAILALLLFSIGCSKEDNIKPPFGSTITMTPETVDVPKSTSRSITAIVLSPDGVPMNGVGVNFSSGSTRATVTPANASTNSGGRIDISVFGNRTGVVTIYGDIGVSSDSTEVTITP